MPWPLSENLIVAGYPKAFDVERWGWAHSGTRMITLCRKMVEQSLPSMLDEHVYHPIPDGQMTPDREVRIWEARDHVIRMMAAPGTVRTVVHCLAGRNRSVLVASLALQWINNWTGEEAFAWARQCRANSLHNEHFEMFLRRLERPK